jgi:LacI family transcriptional regulator
VAVTRNDVARLAGVSPAVVSYVMNSGSRPVSEATRQRVLRAMDDLDYHPDELARALRVGTSRTIGLVLPDPANPFFAELARAVENAAFARRHAVLICSSADDPAREASYVSAMARRRIDGLILVSAREDTNLTKLVTLSIPVVALDRSPDNSPISTIRADNEAGAYQGTMHLIEHGHTSIGFVGGPAASGTSQARRSGWLRALAEAELAPGWKTEQPFNYSGGHAAGKALLGVRPRPTAALIASDVQAIGTLNALHRTRASRLAVVSFDGTEAGRYASPPLTSVAQDITAMAEAAVAHLIDSPGSQTHQTIANRLILRRSCGCTPS